MSRYFRYVKSIGSALLRRSRKVHAEPVEDYFSSVVANGLGAGEHDHDAHLFSSNASLLESPRHVETNHPMVSSTDDISAPFPAQSVLEFTASFSFSDIDDDELSDLPTTSTAFVDESREFSEDDDEWEHS
eukprot:TRINITY_DN56450_c0_g1_i1.p1 TRINITY_DN56450_c0_g1~~TRINITY_DN56450_c0_g1_i1.p1  ORF type:complete len:131 (-),score=19.30 TRINITY_DN56450_c0_g1_i1:237-629(-)